MIKLSDFLFKHLVEKHQIHHCFLVTGGGAMHLNDSIGHTEGLTYVCNHHEQASAIAAEGYYRAGGHLCVTNVTTGPGGTNAITGVLGQWLDSIPALYISGQIKRETMLGTYPELPLRQLGDQEADIVAVVKPITKYAKTIVNPEDIQYELDKAIDSALSGRPGPVWLDIPLDVQAAMIDEKSLREFSVSDQRSVISDQRSAISDQLDELLAKITQAKSPVIYVGNGVRLANRVDEFIRLAERLNIPVVTAISGSDIIWYDHRLCFGKPGICGDRIGNIMVQNSDLLIILGTRLSLRQVSYAYKLLAPKAYKVMVDIDEAEMHKPTLQIDLAIHADLRDAIDMLLQKTEGRSFDFSHWCEWGREIEKQVPTLFEDNPDMPGYCNSYKFADELFKQLQSGDVVVTGNGTAYTCTYQAMRVKRGVRVFANQGCAAMGYDLPAAIGAITANTNGRTILVTGDGSLQMNIQELQTLVTYKMPLKVFVLENEGYLAIKTTQKTFFGGHFTGSNPASGVICPDLHKIADAYGIPYLSISENGKALEEAVAKTLATEGPVICEVHMHPEQTLFPKSASFMDKQTGKMTSAPLEKMAPFMNEDLQAKCVYNG